MPRNPRHPRLLLNRALRISRRHGIAVENVSPRAPAERGTQPIPLATPGAVPRGIRFPVFTRNMALQAIFAWQTLFAGASVTSMRRNLPSCVGYVFPCSRETWPSRPFSLGKHCLLVRASHPCDAVFCLSWDTFSNVSASALLRAFSTAPPIPALRIPCGEKKGVRSVPGTVSPLTLARWRVIILFQSAQVPGVCPSRGRIS